MIGALEQAVETVEADGEIRAVILTGAGDRAFCVGADIGEWSASSRSTCGGAGSGRATACSTAWRAPAAAADRGAQRPCARRRSRTRRGGRPAHRRGPRQGRPAGSRHRHGARAGRHAAPRPPGRRAGREAPRPHGGDRSRPRKRCASASPTSSASAARAWRAPRRSRGRSRAGRRSPCSWRSSSSTPPRARRGRRGRRRSPARSRLHGGRPRGRGELPREARAPIQEQVIP